MEAVGFKSVNGDRKPGQHRNSTTSLWWICGRQAVTHLPRMSIAPGTVYFQPCCLPAVASTLIAASRHHVDTSVPNDSHIALQKAASQKQTVGKAGIHHTGCHLSVILIDA
jgi:hypothetical protein